MQGSCGKNRGVAVKVRIVGKTFFIYIFIGIPSRSRVFTGILTKFNKSTNGVPLPYQITIYTNTN
jgi:hypothetical protein